MQFQSHRLDNGLEIITERNPDSRLVSCGFFVRTGSRDESPELSGVSHFLEHMVFKGTSRRNSQEVNRELDDMGSHSNAQTGEESTIYHATVLPEFQTEMVDLLADLMRPALRDDDFEMEKQVILEEIRMYDDQPPYGGYERAMREYFGDHPLGQSILGTAETVGGLTPGQMRAWFRQSYVPTRMAFVATGNVDFERLVQDLENRCGDWNGGDGRRIATRPAGRSGLHVLCKPESTQEYILQIARGPAAGDPERYAMRLLTTILGDDSGSRMFWEFIDTGLAETASAASHEYLNAGTVLTYVSCAPEDTSATLDRLQRLQAEILSRPVTDHELTLARSKIISNLLLAGERTENRLFSVGGQWLRGYEHRTPREIAELYQAVTLDDVHEVAQAFPLEENVTLCTGPLEKL